MKIFKKTIFIPILTLMLAIVFIWFFIFPTLIQIRKISENISSLKFDLANLERRAENIKDFKKQFPTIKENLSLFENQFVDREFPLEFINFLENLAKGSQISYEVSLLKSEKNYLSFQITAIGPPRNVFRFIEKFENCPYLVQIEKLNISKLSETEIKAKGMEKIAGPILKSIFSFQVQTK
jgi:Tfp pilus assembly protein PilO